MDYFLITAENEQNSEVEKKRLFWFLIVLHEFKPRQSSALRMLSVI